MGREVAPGAFVAPGADEGAGVAAEPQAENTKAATTGRAIDNLDMRNSMLDAPWVLLLRNLLNARRQRR